MELVDTLALGASAFGREGSSPFIRTSSEIMKNRLHRRFFDRTVILHAVMMKKIGIFSGSFDPIHEGHLTFAREAMLACELSTVIFMPERFPRGKPTVTPASKRIAQLETALDGTSFRVLDLSVDTFTVQKTLPELQSLYPDSTFTFLIGSDVALHLTNWRDISLLTQNYDFAVGMRANDSADDIQHAMTTLNVRYRLINTPYSHLSSRSLRS